MSDRDLQLQELKYGGAFDNCVRDSAIKTGGGSMLGGFFSLLFTRARKWPVIFGAGVGFGLSLTACQSGLRNISFTRDVTMEVPATTFKNQEVAESVTPDTLPAPVEERMEIELPTEEIVMQDVVNDNVIVFDALSVATEVEVETPEV